METGPRLWVSSARLVDPGGIRLGTLGYRTKWITYSGCTIRKLTWSLLLHKFSKAAFSCCAQFIETSIFIIILPTGHPYTKCQIETDAHLMLHQSFLNIIFPLQLSSNLVSIYWHLLASSSPYAAISFPLKMWSAYYICCMYSNALQNTFTMEANTMNPEQTAP